MAYNFAIETGPIPMESRASIDESCHTVISRIHVTYSWVSDLCDLYIYVIYVHVFWNGLFPTESSTSVDESCHTVMSHIHVTYLWLISLIDVYICHFFNRPFLTELCTSSTRLPLVWRRMGISIIHMCIYVYKKK